MARPGLTPDPILTNGRIVTADENNGVAEAVAVWGGRIVASGGAGDVEALRG